jgi:5'-nucleotidase
VADSAVLASQRQALLRAEGVRERPLGVVVTSSLRRAYDEECALGNLVADVMRRAAVGSEVALMNGGGIRADFPAGPLTYGSVFEALPFDNRIATLRLRGAELRRVVEQNLARKSGGILSVSGVRVTSTCGPKGVHVSLTRDDGRPVNDDDDLLIATNDFMATGGDGAFDHVAPRDVVLQDGEPVRELVVEALRQRGRALRGDDVTLFDPKRPRIGHEGRAHARCP